MRAFNPLLEIDLAALCRNYRRLAQATPSAEAAAVVKCDAYGLGAAAVARALASRENCRSFFVAYSEEGVALRAAIGPAPAIFVFNGPFEPYLSAYRDSNLIPVINTVEQATLWAAKMPGAAAAVHFDTGMRRLGLRPEEAEAIGRLQNLNVTIVMSHLASASDSSHPMNEAQRIAMERLVSAFPAVRASLSSSGGALLGSTFGFDLTRVGVGMYGVSPFDKAAAPMEPVARLTAPVLQVQEIQVGETVGYSATFTARRRTVLATVSLGYGDGYPRAGSNSGAAALGGALCPIAGRVSMDLIVLDATDAPRRPAVGDRAEFFGREMPIDEAAARCGTIGYELLTAIGGLSKPGSALGVRVERGYLWNGEPADATLVGA